MHEGVTRLSDKEKRQMDIKEEISQEIEEKILGMDRVDELCARVLVNLGQTIAMLLTNRDHARLDELERIMIELFEEARKAKDAARTVH
jgi:hypothetical protein